MNFVIKAREKSHRFPRKHLAMIGGVTLIAGIVHKCLRHGNTYLATGPFADNRRLGEAALQAGATVYYEEGRPEWDIHFRVMNLCAAYRIDSFLIVSGDSPWIDERLIELIGPLTPPDGGTIGAEGPTAPGGIEATRTRHLSTKWWNSLCDGVSLDDHRREEPGQFGTGATGQQLLMPLPWARPTGTAIKTSIDYPLEAAIADKICRWMGRWPRNDDEIVYAYKEITEL